VVQEVQEVQEELVDGLREVREGVVVRPEVEDLEVEHHPSR